MSAILISDDANSWFESGYVRNVTIRNNKFINCGEPVINIHPENSEIDKQYFVHKNIHITDNLFKLEIDDLLLSAKSTGNIKFSNNIIDVNKDIKIKDLVCLYDCSDIEINANKVKNSVVNNMYIKRIKQ